MKAIKDRSANSEEGANNCLMVSTKELTSGLAERTVPLQM